MKLMSTMCLSALLGCATLTAQAQSRFPERPIVIVVPYPAGGTSDAQVRMIQVPLEKLLGQPIIVENKPGASGALAAVAVAKAKPDGYTLLYPNNGFLIAPLLNKSAGYDPLKGFAPVSVVTNLPMVLVINKNEPANDLPEFIKYARSHPQGIMYASAGTASYGHLATTLFSQMAGIKAEHIPYKGEANTTLAVRNGEVSMLLTSPSSVMLGQVKQGNLKLLGVASAKPSSVVLGVKPIAETIPGFTAELWFGLLAPAGTPAAVIDKLNAAVRKVLQDEGIQSKLVASGALAQSSTPAEFANILNAEYGQWADVISKNNIKSD